MIDSKKGRGIVTTKDIECGELVLVERAFSFGRYMKGNDGNVFIQSFDEQCSTAYSGRNQELILNTISKCTLVDWKDFIHFNGEQEVTESVECIWNKWRFLQLYDGNADSLKMPKENMMETFRCRNLRDFLDDDEIQTVRDIPVTAKRVNDVIMSNAFETLLNPKDIIHFLGEDEGDTFDVIKNERYCGSGLFVIGSLFNHCSEANAKRIMFNQHMLIRAKCDIRKGEEVTISYVGGSTVDKQENEREELKNWGIDG